MSGIMLAQELHAAKDLRLVCFYPFCKYPQDWERKEKNVFEERTETC
jgi:hypothetical protein